MRRLIAEASGADGARGVQGNATRALPLLETSDVAEELGVSANGVRYLVAVGALKVWNTTLRGGRLFDPREVARVTIARAAWKRRRRLERLRRVELPPRRMLKAGEAEAKAIGSSLEDALAKCFGKRAKKGRVA